VEEGVDIGIVYLTVKIDEEVEFGCAAAAVRSDGTRFDSGNVDVVFPAVYVVYCV